MQFLYSQANKIEREIYRVVIKENHLQARQYGFWKRNALDGNACTCCNVCC